MMIFRTYFTAFLYLSVIAFIAGQAADSLDEPAFEQADDIGAVDIEEGH